jgi:hypothetical protein
MSKIILEDKDILLISKFCLTLDTDFLLDLNDISSKLFIKHSKKVMNREHGYKNIAHTVLTFYNMFDDGVFKPFNIKKFEWPFKDDIIDFSKLSKTSSVNYRTTITINNINLQLLKSALQKYIRRNMTHKAIWCGLEWGLLRGDMITEDRNLKSVITNLRNRLRIIYLEDIGISNLNLLEMIDSNINIIDYNKNPEGKNMDKVIVDIISNMSQSYHTRICSYVNSIYKIYNNKTFFNKHIQYLKYFPNIKNIYDYIEEHKEISFKNNLLKSLQEKNIVCFYYAQQLNFYENEKGKFGKNNEIFPIIRKVIDSEFKNKVDICEKWYNEIKNSEAFLCYFIPMLIICFPIKENGKLFDYFDYTPEWKNLVMYNIEKKAILFEQYTMDMHTREGNMNGLKKDNLEGVNHFIKQGSYVNNEYELNIELKNYYEFTKLLSVGKIEDTYYTEIKELNKENTEKDFFDYITRAQIPTSGSKTDSYYAKIKHDYKKFKIDETVFVKGPFLDNNVYNILKLFIKMKKIMNIPYINIEKVSLKMSLDFFTGEVVDKYIMGKSYIRNKLDKNNMYTFVIYENLCNDIYIEKYGYLKTQKSVNWINTNATVLNLNKTDKKFHHFELEDLKNEKYLLEYIESLYFRYLFGIVDSANRNFLIVNNRLFGIDEENIDMDNDSNFSKLTKQFEYINNNWDKVCDKIIKILQEWNNKLPEIIKILDNKIYCKFVKRLNIITQNPKIIFN